jgi:hypothetical protein
LESRRPLPDDERVDQLEERVAELERKLRALSGALNDMLHLAGAV